MTAVVRYVVVADDVDLQRALPKLANVRKKRPLALPSTGAAQAAIAQARATADAEYAHFDATVLNALQETDSALATSLAQLADMQVDVFLALGCGWE